MKSVQLPLKHSARCRQGSIALEWILLLTIVVIGVLGGLAAVRNATVKEITDLSKAVEQINIKTSAEIAAEGGS